MKIILRFDDNDILSEIYVNGQCCTESRLQNHMMNKPADKWIKPFNTRYTVWKGFWAEMRELFNTRQFDIQFVGTAKAYEKFLAQTSELVPANFNISYEVVEIEKSVPEEHVLDSGFITQLLSMLRDKNSFFAMNLRKMQKDIDKINCNVIYENYRESQFIRQMFDCPIQINGMLRDIAMPLILVSDKRFSEDPHEICCQQQIDPADAMIIVVGQNQQEVKSQAMQLKQIWKDVPIFSLTNLLDADRAEIEQMMSLYNSYKKKKFRRIVSAYPDDTWTNPQVAKNLIATL